MATEASAGAARANARERARAGRKGALERVGADAERAGAFMVDHWVWFAGAAGLLLVYHLLARTSGGIAGAATGAFAPGAAGIAGPQGTTGAKGAPGKRGLPGQSAQFVYHVPRPGESFASISRAYGVSKAALAAANPAYAYEARRPNAPLKRGLSVLVPRSRPSVIALRTARQRAARAKRAVPS